MNYSDTLEFLYSSLPMYQRIGQAAYRSDLETTLRLDKHLGCPHRHYKTIHIAGTNGKGSVSHMLASILQSAGYKTGLYTSPHYIDYRERIRLNGKKIGKQYVIDFVRDNTEIIKELKPSFFEMTAAMAFEFFKDEKVDVAVIETGMGGRLDSTNIITPMISVITNIGLDHTRYLGDTIGKIAAEKAGIIKRRVPVVIGQTQANTKDIFLEKAAEKEADIYFADQKYSVRINGGKNDIQSCSYNVYREGKPFLMDLCTDMQGDFQALNIITVMQARELLAKSLKLDDAAVFSGLGNVRSNTGFMGRWQIIRKAPLIVCDSAHNIEGIKLSMAQLMKTGAREFHIVFGIVNDKDADTILGLLPPGAKYYFARASVPRALDSDILRGKAEEYSLPGQAFQSVWSAFLSAMEKSGKDDVIYIGGSSFVVADFLEKYYAG